MSNRTDIPSGTASPSWLSSFGDLLWVIYLGGLGVAGFAFTVSYTHIYDLGAAHAQHGVADVMLPLSVDLLIVVASLVLFRQSRLAQQPEGLARWLPRIVLWSGIAATVAANVAYGLPHGWLSAVISGWPGAAFVGVVEMVMVAVRPEPHRGGELAGAVPVAVPAAAAGRKPLPAVRQIREEYDCGQATAVKIRRAMRTRDRDGGVLVPEPSLNGSGPHV